MGKLGVVGRNAKAKAVSRVVNEVGEVKEGEEAVGVWKRHCERIIVKWWQKSIGDWKTVR